MSARCLWNNVEESLDQTTLASQMKIETSRPEVSLSSSGKKHSLTLIDILPAIKFEVPFNTLRPRFRLTR